MRSVFYSIKEINVIIELDYFMLLKRILYFILLLLLSALFFISEIYFKDIEFNKYFYSFLAISIFYLLFKIILEWLVAKRIKESKGRYTFRKVTQILFLVLSGIVILRIWIVNPQALLVAYGLVAAGVAIALQDLFKNFAGGIVILLTGIYHVGDRIEVANKYGDVIDIGILYTSLLEIKGWVAGEQATGRISLIPNGSILAGNVNNYTKDHDFLWDEISLPISYDSDWNEAIIILKEIAKKETALFIDDAKKSLSKLEERYYLQRRPLEPAVYVVSTDNWVQLNLRYIVPVRERRVINNKISQLILKKIQKNANIKIASSTLAISEFPDIRIE